MSLTVSMLLNSTVLSSSYRVRMMQQQKHSMNLVSKPVDAVMNQLQQRHESKVLEQVKSTIVTSDESEQADIAIFHMRK